ncbi:MAG: peptide deformylase [Bacteroidales bacterium]|nr:peptide deformylase [Bacteroidales bacterium]MBR1678597.1 peptide deformylase [Bacteroidales bacterium]
MIQPIYLYGSEVLRKKAQEADLEKKEELTALIQDLKDTLQHADGCGLAAPQIGVSLRVVIVDGDVVSDVYDYLKGFRRVFINPVILEESEEKTTYQEGCLSIPNLYCDVVRPARITVEYYNERFEKVTETFDKFGCRMIQHELSHLDGNLFTDNVPPIRKKMIAGKLQNIAKGKVHPHYNSKLK